MLPAGAGAADVELEAKRIRAGILEIVSCASCWCGDVLALAIFWFDTAEE